MSEFTRAPADVLTTGIAGQPFEDGLWATIEWYETARSSASAPSAT